QWNEVIPVLGKDLNLILIEVRGHGKSWPPPIDGTIEQLAKDVILVADNEKLGHFYVGGHSIGGMISKEVGRSWPQRVKGVISIEGWTHWQASRDAFNGDMYGTLTPVQQKKRLKGRKIGAGHWTKEQRNDFATIWRKWERGMEFLQNTNLPIIEIYGDRGKKRPSLKQLHIPDRSNIEVHWIYNASHSLPLERPGEVATTIMEFIKKLESRKE
ncbi:MAG: alpha/beta hydrolase, partial [Melioribacteraceae bacterium]|nr:alpha/beta hydrolase [Melioribacteraceae bacterium]